jgi:GntR family transcriptional regulator
MSKIKHGELAAGDVIPSEAQRKTAFQVSRLTVRPSLCKLRVEGYVIPEKSRGTFVGGSAVYRHEWFKNAKYRPL